MVLMNGEMETKMIQTTMALGIFAFTVGCTVECFRFKRRGVVVEIFEENVNGRVPARVVDLETGADMMPYRDECTVVRPYIGRRGPVAEMSADTAERFAAYARAR